MNKDHLYAYYGSLRRGMSNYNRYERSLQYLFTETVPGFRLHALKWYPYAVRSDVPGDTIVAEVFRVTSPVAEQAIHDLEIGVGYAYREVEIRGKQTGIYLFEKAGTEPFVNGGDWVEFFGTR